MNLVGKSALVTGGSLGIGRAILIKLAEAGADVAFNYLKSRDNEYELVNETIKIIEELGHKCIAIECDVSNFSEAENTIKKIISEFGKIDILVNNAGINKDGVIWKMTEEQWDTVLDINLKGYFNYIRAVAPYFREQNSGKIINITSINGMRGKFGQSNYAASKAGIIGLTKSVAKELGKYSVNVNAIAPGLIETDMMKEAPIQVREDAIKDIVLNRIGQPDDIANTVLFLSSELSRHITGEIIKVDGGQYI